jgi:DNA processing protein
MALAPTIAQRGTHVWMRGDADYPIRDVEVLPEMPPVLLGEGRRLDAFDAPRVAIVGTRAATPLGALDAHEIAAFLAGAGVTIVSGLAIGIDGAAHGGALAAGGLTVGVVATGLDVVYPLRHRKLSARVRKHGMIIGEHGFGVQPLPWRFPIRNRIIAALADAVVVVEATCSGGTRHTTNYALEYGRPVYALPGSRRNPSAAGCNELIAEGAIPLLDPSDVLVALGRGGTVAGGWAPAPAPTDPAQKRVLEVLGGEPATIDALERRTGFSAARLGAALRALEQRGRLQRKRGLWWPS